MDEEQEDFGGINAAWAEFTHALVDRILDGEPVLWELDVPERLEVPTGPYVRVVPSPEGGLVAEASSNRVLARRYRLGQDARRELRGLGWRRPDAEHENHWLSVGDVDVAALAMVGALRDVFGVIHPAFLVDRARELDPALGGFEPEVLHPDSPDHLSQLVDAALAPSDPEEVFQHDEDGDIPFIADSAVVFVRVLRNRPVVRVFCELVVGIQDLPAAAFEVGVLNRDHEFKFVLREDTIVMSVDLLAWPFVAEHLRLTLDEMCRLAPALDGDLAKRVRGRRFIESPHGDAA